METLLRRQYCHLLRSHVFRPTSFYRKPFGLNELIYKVEYWANYTDQSKRPNQPIAIIGPSGSGKTLFIQKWMNYHKSGAASARDDLYIYYSAESMNVDHSHTSVLYYIQTKLRALLNLKHRVPLDEPSLRTLLGVMLDIAQREKDFYVGRDSRIFLILDGIDLLMKEGSDCEDLFWLPEVFPESFRVILTCNSESTLAKKFLANRNIRCFDIPMPSAENIRSVIKQYAVINKLKNISYDTFSLQNYLSLKMLLAVCYPVSPSLPSFKIPEGCNLSSPKAVFKEILVYYEDKILPSQKFAQFWKTLALAYLGIVPDHLSKILDLKKTRVEAFLEVFAFAFIKGVEDSRRVNGSILQEAIYETYLNNEEKIVKHHQMIGLNLLREKKITPPLCEEILYHLIKGKVWMKVKDYITKTEVFAYMYTAPRSYRLFKTWEQLIQEGFDPVAEYNKAVEEYSLRYFPSARELFIILFMLSRFFREISDLEGNKMPEYRHPLIKKSGMLKDIGIKAELKRNSDLKTNRGMLTDRGLDPHRKEYDFSVDNPIGRARFEKAIREEVKIIQSRQKDDPVYGFYHYKRWLWLQFPWICLDMYVDYSKLINVCFGFKGYTYLSFKAEQELIQKLDNIIINAKERKVKKTQSAITSATPHALGEKRKFFASETLDAAIIGDDGRNLLPDDLSTDSRESTQRFRKPSLDLLKTPLRPSTVGRNQSGDFRIRPTSIRSSQKSVKSIYGTTPNTFRSRHTSIKEINAREEPVDGANIGKVLHKLNQYVFQKNVFEVEVAQKLLCSAQREYNKVVAELDSRKTKLAWLKEEQKKLKFDAGRQESLKNAADLKVKIRDTKRDLNEALKEQKRLEMIHTVCLRNLAKNEEWINCLEQEIRNCGEMITYLSNKIHLFYAAATQKEMDQKVREELFKEREQAIKEFVKAMQNKTAALAEPPVEASVEENTRTLSGRIAEIESESNQDDGSPRSKMHTRNMITTLKAQETTVKNELIEKTLAVRTIASIAGVDDISKTEEIVKYFKQTAELEKIKQEMEQRIIRLSEELIEQRKVLNRYKEEEEAKRETWERQNTAQVLEQKLRELRKEEEKFTRKNRSALEGMKGKIGLDVNSPVPVEKLLTLIKDNLTKILNFPPSPQEEKTCFESPVNIVPILKSPPACKVQRKTSSVDQKLPDDSAKEIDKEFYIHRAEERTRAKLMLPKAVIAEGLVSKLKPTAPIGSPRKNPRTSTYHLIHKIYLLNRGKDRDEGDAKLL